MNAVAALPIAVLASGRGSNFAALLAAQQAGRLPVRFTLIAGDHAEAPALHHAAEHGLATFALDPRGFAERAAYDAALFEHVAASGAELVVLAGFMRILDATVTRAWHGKIINIHPSLLPKYRGLHTHRKALRAGDPEHGASVHYVTAELDGGPVIAQARIPVHAGDDEDALAARLLPEEHRLLPACVDAIARGAVRLAGDTVWFHDTPIRTPLRLDAAGHLVNT